jgi:co-chaperonin GroES (HSP10)
MSSNELKAGAVTLESGQQFTVQGNRVLIECESDTDTYGSSGLIKPEDYKKYSRFGKIIQIGGDVAGIAVYPIFAGDRVCYDAYTGQDVELNGKDYKIIAPENLLCKVEA